MTDITLIQAVKELEKRNRELMDKIEMLEKDLGKRITTG